MKKQALRIGVLIRNSVIPAWQHTLIEKLLAYRGASSVIIFIDEPVNSDENASGIGLRIYDAFVARDTRSNFFHPSAVEEKSIFETGLESARILAIDPEYGKRSSEWSSELTDKLKEHDLSLMLALGSDWPIKYLSSIAKLGAWYFEFGEGRASQLDDSACGFWEVIRRDPAIRSRLLVRLPGRTADRVAYETYSGVDHCSHFLCRNEHLWKLCNVVPRVLEQLDATDDEELRHLESCDEVERDSASSRHAAFTTVNLLLPLPRYVIWRLWRKLTWALFTEEWNLSFKLGGNTLDFSDFQTLKPEDGRFWADPHVLRVDGQYHIFFEDASVESGKGHISLISSADGRTFSSPRPIIEKPYHLSYPFVFEWNDNYYLIPESAENRTIELYKCKRFPDSWKLDRVLMHDIRAYDATLLQHDHKWWMFANVCDQAGASSWDELYIFYAESPLSRNWIPHPLNPVVSDVRQARPAGRLFRKGGKFYRPSQDSSNRYGYALKLNEIRELSETQYEESTVERCEPNWSPFIKAVHSFSKAGNLTFIDVIAQRWNRRR